MALGVKDLEKSVAFYRTLFGQGPTRDPKPGRTVCLDCDDRT
jgi:hypothetical protein